MTPSEASDFVVKRLASRGLTVTWMDDGAVAWVDNGNPRSKNATICMGSGEAYLHDWYRSVNLTCVSLFDAVDLIYCYITGEETGRGLFD